VNNARSPAIAEKEPMKVLKLCSYRGTSYSLVQTLLLYRMYRLATMRSVRDGRSEGRTDRQTTI